MILQSITTYQGLCLGLDPLFFEHGTVKILHKGKKSLSPDQLKEIYNIFFKNRTQKKDTQALFEIGVELHRAFKVVAWENSYFRSHIQKRTCQPVVVVKRSKEDDLIQFLLEKGRYKAKD